MPYRDRSIHSVYSDHQNGIFPGFSDNVATAKSRWFQAICVIAFSFSLLALFDNEEVGTTSVSIFTLSSVFCIALLTIRSILWPKTRILSFITFTTFFIGILIYLSINSMFFYNSEKLNQFILIIVIFGLSTFCLLSQKDIAHNLAAALLISGVVALILLVLNPSAYDAGRITYANSNPIWMGRILGAGALAALALSVQGNRYKLALAVLAFVLLAASTLTGSRGPVFSSIVAAATVFLLAKFKNKHIVLAIAIFLVVFVGLLAFGLLGLESRAVSFGSFGDESYGHRAIMVEYSQSIAENYPDGIGIGQFVYEGFTYPHNIFLEFFVEWGSRSGMVFTSIIVLGVASCLFFERNLLIIPLMAVFEVFNASVSGDITSPRLLYALVIYGLWLLFDRLSRRRDHYHSKSEVMRRAIGGHRGGN